VDITQHKEAVLKAHLLPWIDEAYIITASIEAKLAQLQATQQRIQGNSSKKTVTKQHVEEVQQVVTQCAVEVAGIQIELGGLCTKIFTPTE